MRLFGSENNEYAVRLSVLDPSGVTIANAGGNFLSKLIREITTGLRLILDLLLYYKGIRSIVSLLT